MNEKDFERLIKLLESLKDGVKYGKIKATGYKYNETDNALWLEINIIDTKGGQ